MFKTIALVGAAAVVLLLGYAATRPGNFRVVRSTTVQAPAGRVHALINDLHQFNSWNPYVTRDPQQRGSYRGPPAGAGAAYDFDGGKSGSGSIRITDSAPTQVAMELRMVKPMAARHQVLFTLAPSGPATQVTWTMEGESPFIGKLLSLFIDMDRMVGRDFEAGLADLKLRAERA
jgi:hypothetical protein